MRDAQSRASESDLATGNHPVLLSRARNTQISMLYICDEALIVDLTRTSAQSALVEVGVSSTRYSYNTPVGVPFVALMQM